MQNNLAEVDRVALSNQLASISFDAPILTFFERFDGQSRIWNFQRHSHSLFEFIYFIEGKAHINAGVSTLEASLSDLVVYPPNVPHLEQLEQAIKQEIYCFWVDIGPTTAFDRGFILNDKSGEILHIIEMIYAQYTSHRHFSKEIITKNLQSLFLLLRQYLSENQLENTSLLERCFRYIHEHYLEEFMIEDLASAVYVSPSYLFRNFKQKTHMTPMHYRNILRTEKAKLLLCDGNNDRIDIIAEKVGFKDVKYFSRLFKKLTGMTPGNFRSSHMSS